MVFTNRRLVSRTDHPHIFKTQRLGADLSRRICVDCGHVSIKSTQPASLRSEITVEKAGLFGGAPAFVYGLARTLTLASVTVSDRPRFGERKTRRQ